MAYDYYYGPFQAEWMILISGLHDLVATCEQDLVYSSSGIITHQVLCELSSYLMLTLGQDYIV